MLWNRLLPSVAIVVALLVVTPAHAQSSVNGAVNEAAAVAAAEAQLVRELELSSPDVERVEPVTWLNSCLVLAAPGELCTQALVDGLVIWFVADGTALRAHTDGDRRSVRIAADRIPAAAVAMAALPAGASLRSAGARGEGTSSDGASGEASDSDAPGALPTTGGGLATAETDDDAPAWVWGVIGVIAAGTVAVGTTYGVWLRRRREEISRGRGSSK